jgi:hypothetical protein
VVMDLAAEWVARTAQRDLVAVWPLHQMTHVSPALHILGNAGIPAHPRAAYHRALLQFVGPHVPVEILVPRARAVEAQAKLLELLAP